MAINDVAREIGVSCMRFCVNFLVISGLRTLKPKKTKK